MVTGYQKDLATTQSELTSTREKVFILLALYDRAFSLLSSKDKKILEESQQKLEKDAKILIGGINNGEKTNKNS
ncbi:hypothetical protein BG262_02670 [Floricoccus penangensis]|uniref:Uncharacterized protein n=1 Tax=Floricoccus penangensis TaxID=1859475 RepID=A0A9Q5P0S3_9LACT|nr:hypothetical protein [Floricoccus penangensis]OFI46719.1 hypothetical protein BG262_02670 [Floricoccus penangensis]